MLGAVGKRDSDENERKGVDFFQAGMNQSQTQEPQSKCILHFVYFKINILDTLVGHSTPKGVNIKLCQPSLHPGPCQKSGEKEGASRAAGGSGKLPVSDTGHEGDLSWQRKQAGTRSSACRNIQATCHACT